MSSSDVQLTFHIFLSQNIQDVIECTIKFTNKVWRVNFPFTTPEVTADIFHTLRPFDSFTPNVYKIMVRAFPAKTRNLAFCWVKADVPL